MIRVGINGYGRIGRGVLRALFESVHTQAFEIVAINEPADLNTIAHLTKYDSTHGRFNQSVNVDDHSLMINGKSIAVSHCQDLSSLSWAGVDLVIECSGQYTQAEQLQAHLDAGAGHVLLSQPGEEALPTIVYGVNEYLLDASSVSEKDSVSASKKGLKQPLRMASAASCTTNGIVPILKVLDEQFGVQAGAITTLHSVMNDQPVLDAYHDTDLRKTRAAGLSMIPVETGLAAGVVRILPQLDGKLSARALRVPTHNVSAMELSVQLTKACDVGVINAALKIAAKNTVWGCTDEPLASCDFIHDARSSVVDLGQTRVSGSLVSLLTWFDNEWGYANRLLDVAAYWLVGSEANS